MKGIYFNIAGDAYVEDINENARSVEVDDGEHAITKNSVYHDIDHKLDAIMLIYQHVADPAGDEVAKALVHETDRLKLRGANLNVDTRFSRRLMDGAWNAFAVLAVFVMSMSIYMFVWVLVWVYLGIMLPL